MWPRRILSRRRRMNMEMGTHRRFGGGCREKILNVELRYAGGARGTLEFRTGSKAGAGVSAGMNLATGAAGCITT